MRMFVVVFGNMMRNCKTANMMASFGSWETLLISNSSHSGVGPDKEAPSRSRC